MKSLKRTLSLVLVLVMVLGLFGVASAAFTDDETIQYKVPVGVMTGMGAINGYPDGSFNPTGTITRAEAAKLVAYTVLGPDTAAGLGGVSSRFTDVGADYAWAIPSIEYLASKGIINGLGDGTFNPEGLVTGYELGKMLLVAVGYGAKGEYVGDSWSLNVAIDGGKKGIYDNRVTGAGLLSAAATREEAALYCYNALGVTMVEYLSAFDIYRNVDGNPTIGSLIYKYTAPTTVSGMITGAAKNARGQTVVSIDNSATAFVYTPDFGLYGHTVKLHTDGISKVYYVEDLSTAYTVPTTVTSATALYNALGGVVTWSNASAVVQFTDYVYSANYDPHGNSTTVTNEAVAALAGKTIVIYNGVINAVVNNPAVTLNVVGSVTTTLGNESILLSTIGSLSNTKANDKVVEYAGIAKGDVVIATSIGNGVYSLAKANAVTGVYTSKSVSATATTYTVGGTAYTASSVPDDTGLSLTAPGSMIVGTEYTLFLDAAGKIIAAKGPSATVSNYAYIAQFGQDKTPNDLGQTSDALVADIYFADGTHGVYPIDTTTAGTAFKNAVYDSGTETATTVKGLGLYDIKLVNGKAVVKDINTSGETKILADGTETKVDLDELSIIRGVSRIGIDADGSGTHEILYADANSMIFYVTGTYGTTTGASAFKVNIITGIANFQTGTAVTEGYYKTSATGTNVLTAALSGTAVVPPVTPDVVFYAGQYVDNTAIVDGAVVVTRTYTVYKNGVATTLSYVASTNGAGTTGYTGQTAAGFYTQGLTDMSAYTTSTDVIGSLTTVDLYSGTLTLSGGTTVQVTDNTVIVDLTPANQTYTALVEAGKTVTVWIDITTNATTGVKTADIIYVTSVA